MAPIQRTPDGTLLTPQRGHRGRRQRTLPSLQPTPESFTGLANGARIVEVGRTENALRTHPREASTALTTIASHGVSTAREVDLTTLSGAELQAHLETLRTEQKVQEAGNRVAKRVRQLHPNVGLDTTALNDKVRGQLSYYRDVLANPGFGSGIADTITASLLRTAAKQRRLDPRPWLARQVIGGLLQIAESNRRFEAATGVSIGESPIGIVGRSAAEIVIPVGTDVVAGGIYFAQYSPKPDIYGNVVTDGTSQALGAVAGGLPFVPGALVLAGLRSLARSAERHQAALAPDMIQQRLLEAAELHTGRAVLAQIEKPKQAQVKGKK